MWIHIAFMCFFEQGISEVTVWQLEYARFFTSGNCVRHGYFLVKTTEHPPAGRVSRQG
jgi:hypothetical protein